MENIRFLGGVVAAGVALAFCSVPTKVCAHFQELLPSTDIVSNGARRSIDLELVFTHPFERGPLMQMGKPTAFGVLANAKKVDLTGSLQENPIDGKMTYRSTFEITAPGDYVFFVEPAPYWESAEQKMIIHYTKVVLGAFGAENGWDARIGLPVEIEPLVRPYGLWTGNQFRGVVLENGKPVPFAEVEVEWRNDGTVTAPADPFVTQVIKADGQGVFSYAMPRAGWWGFAALIEANEKMKSPAGGMVPVELGGLIWVRTVDMK